MIPQLILENTHLLACPSCEGEISGNPDHSALSCRACSRHFAIEKNIPRLFVPHDRGGAKDHTPDVMSFYEAHPFPNYQDFDSIASLREKAENGIFARLLDAQIPHGSKVLEVGCGTGQLSNFLGIREGRLVFGTDMCIPSLSLGQEFKEKHKIGRVAFLQMNLFRPALRQESFHVVISNGVLHHTDDTYEAYRSILRLVKKGGFIIVGLYNKMGRVPTHLRRTIFKFFGEKFYFLDPYLRKEDLGNAKRKSWFMDQYHHPKERTHTFGEVLQWFDQTGVEFISSLPLTKPFQSFGKDNKLFAAQPRGSWLDHSLAQVKMLLQGGAEGGLFIVIGRRKNTPL